MVIHCTHSFSRALSWSDRDADMMVVGVLVVACVQRLLCARSFAPNGRPSWPAGRGATRAQMLLPQSWAWPESCEEPGRQEPDVRAWASGHFFLGAAIGSH